VDARAHEDLAADLGRVQVLDAGGSGERRGRGRG
jgi:hypothetical protein